MLFHTHSSNGIIIASYRAIGIAQFRINFIQCGYWCDISIIELSLTAECEFE